MPTLYDKNCLHCGIFFQVIPRKKKQKYCSQQCCKDATRNPNRLTHCSVCSSPLTKDTQFKFCSTNCSAILSNQKRTTESRKKQRESLIKTLTENGTVRTDIKELYFLDCDFGKWPLEVWKQLPGFELLVQKGIWHPVKNPDGVVRDHIISKYFGWNNKIDPKYISHPANCRIIKNYENIKKGSKVDTNFDQLVENIKNYKIQFNEKEFRNDYFFFS